MPIYEYECIACRHSFERIMKVGEEAPVCPACGADRPKRRINAFRTNAWSAFLDGMEKRLSNSPFQGLKSLYDTFTLALRLNVVSSTKDTYER